MGPSTESWGISAVVKAEVTARRGCSNERYSSQEWRRCSLSRVEHLFDALLNRFSLAGARVICHLLRSLRRLLIFH